MACDIYGAAHGGSGFVAHDSVDLDKVCQDSELQGLV